MTITRIFQSGAEGNSLAEFPFINASGYFYPYATPYTGSYSWRVVARTSVGTTLPYGRVYCSPTRRIRGGFHKYGSANYNYGLLLPFRTSGASFIAGIECQPEAIGGGYRVNIGGTPYGAIAGISDDTSWIHIGFDAYITSGSDGWFYVYKNGVKIIDYNGATGDSDIEMIDIGHCGYDDSGYTWYLDNIYYDDMTGETNPVQAPPAKKFYFLTPNGNGNYMQWLKSSGSDGYLLVDEIPPNDDTDYIETDIPGNKESFQMATLSLESGESIKALIPLVYGKREGNSEEIKIGTRLSSTDELGLSQALPVSYGYLWERQETKPGGGTWGQSDLDNVELLIESSGSF